MMGRHRILLVILIAALLSLLAWRLQPQAMLGAYLVAWWFWSGTLMGGLANVWLHNLTGGRWGEAIRGPLLHGGRSIPFAALLFIPVLLGLYQLYPWAAHADAGAVRWADDLAVPAFKSWWLMPGFFIIRSVLYLLAWSALATLSRRPVLARSQPFSAFALIAYGFTTSLASVDWAMSLVPLWYSSVFGWLVGTGQMLAGLALGIVLASRRQRLSSQTSGDLGNLLLMYVMTWAYLAFSQFLIIWAENLPHEIIWYVARRRGPWPLVAWILVLGAFVAPLLILLSRHVKRTPRLLSWLALALLTLQLLDTCWLILPSLPLHAGHWLWALPLAAMLLAAIASLLWKIGAAVSRGNRPAIGETRHA